MNSLRISVVQLTTDNCKDHKDYPFALMVSQDNLIWWPINRFRTMDEALANAKAFETFSKTNQLVKIESTLWTSKL